MTMKKRRGFSLIEAILALSIFSVLALCLYGTFSSGMMLNRRGETTDEVYRQMRWTMARVADELTSMVNYDFKNSKSEMTACVGERDRIAFLLPTPQGLKIIRYQLDSLAYGTVHKTVVGEHYSDMKSILVNYKETATNYALIREEEDFASYFGDVADNNSSPSGNGRSVLSANIKAGGLKFLYAYQQGEEENFKIVWKDKWDLPQIPRAVQVQISFVDPEDKNKERQLTQNIFIPTGTFGVEK